MTPPPAPPPPPPPEPQVLRGHEAGVQALAFLPPGVGDGGDAAGQQLLVSGDAHGIVKLWDLASCRPRLSFPTPTGPPPTAGAAPLQGVLSLHPLAEGTQLLTQLRGGVFMTWDLAEGEARTAGAAIATGAYHFCKAARPNPTTNSNSSSSPFLLTPSADSGAFALWDLRTPAKPALTFQPPPVDETGGVGSLAALAGAGGGAGRGLCMALQLLLDPDGAGDGGTAAGYALAAYEDGSLHAFDLRASASAAACSARLLKETVLSMDVGPSRTRGVLGSAGSELVIFGLDLAQHRIVEEKRLALSRPGVADIRVRPDEKLFAVGGWDHRVRAYRFGGNAPGTPLAVLKCHAESVQALVFGSGGVGKMPLASGGKDARIAVWDLYPPG